MASVMKSIFVACVALATVQAFSGGIVQTIRGPICRFANYKNGSIINETGCPFSDMNPAPYKCVKSEPWWGGFPSWLAIPTPKFRKDYCEIEIKIEPCDSDADCTTYPGLMTSRCVYGYCVPRPTSVARAALAAEPCEISRQDSGQVNFRDLTNCKQNDWSSTGNFFSRDDDVMQTCEAAPSITVKVGNVTYNLKTCVSAANTNNEP